MRGVWGLVLGIRESVYVYVRGKLMYCESDDILRWLLSAIFVLHHLLHLKLHLVHLLLLDDLEVDGLLVCVDDGDGGGG